MATDARKERGTLTRETVVEAALAKLDREGIEAVSFRRLASELGVTPMALYRYVSSKEELLSAVTERVFEEFELPEDDDGDWQDQLRGLARTFRRVLVAHPAIAALHFAGLEAGSASGLRIVNVVLGALRRAGFSSEEAAMLSGTLERFVLALVALEVSGGEPLSGEDHQAKVRAFRGRLMTLPPAEFRHVNDAMEYMCEPCDPDWAFEVALELLIGGLEKLLQSPGRVTGRLR